MILHAESLPFFHALDDKPTEGWKGGNGTNWTMVHIQSSIQI